MLKIDAILTSVFSVAAQQNSFPLLRRANLVALDNEELPLTHTDISVRLTSDPILFEQELWKIDRIDSGQTIRLQERPLKVHYDTLKGLTEELKVRLVFEIIQSNSDDNVISTSTYDVSCLPPDHWGGESRQPELLAAFVQPNTHAVEQIVAGVGTLLRKAGEKSAIDGYHSNTRERPYLFGSALWSTIFNQRLMYVSPPAGWAATGQRIRSAADIQTHKTAACLDTSILFASCLENMGLNPVIALTREHAFAGFWLVDDRFPVLTNDDAMDLRKRIATSDLVMFETTLVTNDSPVTFNQSIDHAKELLSEDKETEFMMVIDIKQARARQIKPLGLVDETVDVGNIENADGIEIGVGTVPVLPPVRTDDRVIEDTPETRVDMWQRKLLDLTKRNPLLNVKASALNLFCPDIGALEDSLAAGEKFKFKAAEDSPLNDSDRDAGVFLMKTGQSIHAEYALNQLNSNVIVANERSKRLDTKLIELLRKAKNDLEEGGSNTLFLGIGMLSWKETPDSTRKFKAPLILLPAQLVRRSAQAPIQLRQLPDEDPIFNLTLIEFLQTDYDINLGELTQELPEDESGVDVHAIWNIVRNAIKDQKGFEVVEEIVLGSFSFAKYLMWKDLRDRVEVLKENPFVAHLVDHPRETYKQDSNFIERHEVDQKIKPEEFFAPLNCDSSQMVAVDASSRPQDFVLEGPPGTGKSETIANIICHNLALGRKVLFVAEKMAALQVVYRRMEKIGLSHLCLELHSSKANKKGVLDQLSQAWKFREQDSQHNWVESAKELGAMRHALNDYVSELHRKSSLGFSARDAISRVVRYQSEHPLRLDWPVQLSQGFVKDAEQVSNYLAAARELGIAFNDLEDVDSKEFEAIQQTSWSNEWRRETISIATAFGRVLGQLQQQAHRLTELLELTLDTVTFTTVEKLSNLSELIELSILDDLSYALNSGAHQRMSSLSEVAELLLNVDQKISQYGHGLTRQLLPSLPVSAWIDQRNQATGLFSFFKRMKLKRTMSASGLSNIKTLANLGLMLEAQETLHKTLRYMPDIQDSSVWRGDETDSEILNDRVAVGHKALLIFNRIIGEFNDPIEPATKLRRVLIEGRDYLSDGSVLSSASNDLKTTFKELVGISNEAEKLKIMMDRHLPLGHLQAHFEVISAKSEKLNRWCHWVAAKNKASALGLGPLSEALQSKLIEPKTSEDNAFTALLVWLAPLLVDDSPTLVQFAASSHENMIQTFRNLDAHVSKTSAQYIAAVTAGKVPDANSSDAPPEYGVLARELSKKTRHRPVRWLVEEMGASLTDLTPCFMMSPLSVAQFLPAGFSQFDLVVFDEASQITTWDAVGTIARGKNVIVVGDPKQMPPSNNFGRTDVDDSDEADMESILDQALAARLPHLRLTGHYRSRHETLIAFSNSHYYENTLTTFPSSETKKSAVSLHRVQGVYAKGKSKTNAIEAQAVVSEVVARLMKMLSGDPIRSIGIVTINSQQQRLVEDKMDEARRKNHELEQFFISTNDYDPIFVKNLESVQGDERDIIVLSMTYGPTEANGKTMSMNFGPLNKEGGERRLNVAVTRATTEVLVFSSFDASMIDLTRTQAKAIAHLKNYLEFAEHGPSALAEYATANYGVDQFDSDFEQGVAFELRALGWKVQTQIGVSKFRVDMGIVHPDRPGEYLAGIECDGATYHGSPSARDRDRVRQVILENLGWRICRLWSTDYFQDPEFAIRKMSGRLQELLDEDRVEIEKPKSDKCDPAIDSFEHVAPIIPSRTIDKNSDTVILPAKSVTELVVSVSGPSVKFETVEFDKDQFFEVGHRENLDTLARNILAIKSGITLHELCQDIAHRHGLKKISKKQRQHVYSIVKDWAGIFRDGVHRQTLWATPAQITDLIEWRGLSPFGVERKWKDLAHEEQLGFAKAALENAPSAPVDWMFKELKLSRRHEATVLEFQQWIAILSQQHS